MITFLLGLLKIIGLIVLILLAILLVLILAILFVPVRYYADGKYHSDFQCIIKISWLLHIFSLKVIAENELQNIIFHVFGIPVWNKNKAEKRKQKKATLNKEIQKSEKKECVNKKEKRISEKKEQRKESKKSQKVDIYATEMHKNEQVENLNKENADYNDEKGDFDKKSVDCNKKKSKFIVLIKKMIEIINKIIDALKNVKSTFFKICDKIKGIFNHIAYYKELYQDERTKRALIIVKKWLKKLFGNIKPQRIKASIHFGFEDPSKVADILRYYSIAYPFIGQNIIVYPDFENKVFKADFHLKGRVTLCWFAYAVWQYLFQKDIRFVKKRIFREEK